jgi:YgiT-type zinc finger domain-containing protein
MVEGTSELVSYADGKLVVIKGVPAFICEICGETWFTYDVSKKIDQIFLDIASGSVKTKVISAFEVEMAA